MKTRIVISILATVAIVIAGCQSEQASKAGVISIEQGAINDVAPDVPFTSAEGAQTSIKKVSEPIRILGFINNTGADCCELNPELLELAKKYKNEYVTVIQISVPTTRCPHGPGCYQYCRTKDENLLALCDEELIAWKSYGQPAPNTIILVDKNNIISAKESILDIDIITAKVQQMIPEVTAQQESMYEGG